MAPLWTHRQLDVPLEKGGQIQVGSCTPPPSHPLTICGDTAHWMRVFAAGKPRAGSGVGALPQEAFCSHSRTTVICCVPLHWLRKLGVSAFSEVKWANSWPYLMEHLDTCLIHASSPTPDSCSCYWLRSTGMSLQPASARADHLRGDTEGKHGGAPGYLCASGKLVFQPFLRDWCLCCCYSSLGNKITSRFHEPNSMSDNFSHSGSYSFCVA